MGAQDVDTRSDVYSLGVLLYELLTGALPFDTETLREGGVDHIRQITCEHDPKTPSMRLTGLGEEAKKVAERRCTEVSTLARRLHRELEWIPLKAMRKERARRYRSASELADDVRNYLNGAPLLAGPESTVYRFRKFVLRHRGSVTGLAAVLAVVAIGAVVSTVFAVKAQRQARISQAVADFLTDDLLGSVAPEKAKSPEVTVGSVLDAAAKSLEGRFEGEPLIEASIREKLGETYRKLGDYKAAGPHLERTYRIRAGLLGEKSEFTRVSIRDLCLLYEISGQFDKLKALFLSNSKRLEKQRTELEEGDGALAGRLNEHAWRRATYPVAELRDGPEAIKNATEACELTEWKLAAYVDTLAAARAEAGEYASAVKWQKKAIDLLTEERRARQLLDFESRLKLYESGQPARQSLARGLAWDAYCHGLYTEAERRLTEALEFCRRVFGEEHSETRACRGHFVDLYEAWGKPEEAEQWRAKLPPRDAAEK